MTQPPEIASTAFDASMLASAERGLSPGDLVSLLLTSWRLMLAVPVLAAALAVAYSYTLPLSFTATTTMLPPQPAQNSAAAALASFGPLAALAGGSSGLRTPAEQFVALMESQTIGRRVVEGLKLGEAWGKSKTSDAVAALARSSSIGVSKQSGLIVVQATDSDPKRAAEIANRYVDELRRFTGEIAVSEAQRRRQYFERLMGETRDRLATAQRALEASGFTAGALKSDAKTAAERYALLQSEVTAAEVKLQAMRGRFTENAVEVQDQQATLAALRAQLGRVEQPSAASSGTDFVSRYREFKYQEALFEVYARQFELARSDESRESAVIQVVDVAMPPERKSGPKRVSMATVAAGAGAIGALLFVLIRAGWAERRQGRSAWTPARAAR